MQFSNNKDIISKIFVLIVHLLDQIHNRIRRVWMFSLIHELCLCKIKKLTHLLVMYIINCNLNIFLVQIWHEQAMVRGKNHSSLSKLKDLCNDVIVSIDNITNVYFFICWQNKRIMAVTCSTDHGTEYNLMSTIQGGFRRYVCTCDGKSTLFSGGTSCYLNYWICPLTT